MVAELDKVQGVGCDFVNQPMFIRNPPRPIARKTMLQWFRFTCPCKGCPLNFLDERINASEDFGVCLLPI
jgi:hypothetical protein